MIRTRRPRYFVSALVGVMLSLLAVAIPATFAQITPTTCTVAADKTPVYAGFSSTYYTLGTVSKGAQVQVLSIELDFFKIAAPAGTFSYVSKAFVDARGDGKSGTVNRDKTPVIAAAADPAVKSDRVQTELSKGTAVQITGEIGSYYKIVPPAGAFAYLAPGSLVDPPVAVLPQPPVSPAPPGPAPLTATMPAGVSTIGPAPATQSSGGNTLMVPPAPVLPAPPLPAPTLATLDEQMKQALKLPLDQQPISELTQAYQALLASGNLTAAQTSAARQRLAILERNAQLQATLSEVHAVKQKIDEAATQPAVTGRAGVQRQPHYDAVGQLQVSAVYDGVKLPKLYRLVDPGTGRTLAYVQPGAAIEPGNCLGRMVGLVSKAQEDPGLKLPVLTVQKADVLEPSAPGAAATQPAEK